MAVLRLLASGVLAVHVVAFPQFAIGQAPHTSVRGSAPHDAVSEFPAWRARSSGGLDGDTGVRPLTRPARPLAMAAAGSPGEAGPGEPGKEAGSGGAAEGAGATDAVTGAKFEEPDKEKNPQERPGHSIAGSEIDTPVDPEVQRKRELIRAHQEKCPKPTWAEEIRTVMQQKEGFGIVSTNAQKAALAGYPVGSVVGFAVDEKGRPFFSFSDMSAHTQNLKKDARAALTVTEEAFKGAADARVTIVGDISPVTDKEEAEQLRARYRDFHPGAFWATFADFGIYRMTTVKDVSFIGGFARAGGVTVDEYMEASPDPLAAFAKPVMRHMNEDHTDALKSYVRYLVGVESDIDEIEMKRLDKFGFDVRVATADGTGVLRIPFAAPVTERKAVKEAIVALSKEAAEKMKEGALAGKEEVVV